MGDGGRKVLSSTARQIIFWLLIVAGALLIYKLVNPGSKNNIVAGNYIGTDVSKVNCLS